MDDVVWALAAQNSGNSRLYTKDSVYNSVGLLLLEGDIRIRMHAEDFWLLSNRQSIYVVLYFFYRGMFRHKVDTTLGE